MKKQLIIGAALLVSQIWGETFTLQMAEQRALDQGYQVRIDNADDSARVWQKRNVVSNYLPNVEYNATLTHIEGHIVNKANSMYAGLENDPGISEQMMRQNTLKHEVSITQPITNGGMEIIAIRLAEHTKQAQEQGYKANRSSLLVEVRTAYYEIMKANEQLRIAADDLAWAEQNRTRSKLKWETGLSSEIDYLQWERTVREKENVILQGEAYKQFAIAQLQASLGESPTGSMDENLQDFTIFETRFGSLEQISGDLSNNASLISLDGYRKVAEDQRSLAVTSALPKLNAFAGWSRENRWDEPDETYSPEGGWASGLALTVPIFSGFRNSTKYLERKYDAIKTGIEYEKTESLMEVNLISIKAFREASRESVENAREQHSLNERSFEILSDRYEVGQSDQLDLLEMNRLVAASRLDYVTKIFETLAYHDQYLDATGTLEGIE